MGVYANLIRYPGSVFEEVKAEETLYPPNGKAIEDCYVDRSWDSFHPAFKTFGYPVSLTLDGDYGFPGGLDSFGWDESNSSDHFLAFVSPTLVKQIAAVLVTLPFAQVASRLPEPSREEKYLEPRYEKLVAFYSAAAEAGDCIFICVA